MPKLACLCGEVINLSAIPCPEGIQVVLESALESVINQLVLAHKISASDADFERLAYDILSTDNKGIAQTYECTHCGRIAVLSDPSNIYTWLTADQTQDNKEQRSLVKMLMDKPFNRHKYALRFFFDYASGVLLWSANDLARQKYDYAVDVNKLPLSDDLKKEINQILAWYDSSLNQEYPPDSPVWNEEECRQFNKSKKDLYEKIAAELGHNYLVIDESHDEYELKNPKFPLTKIQH